MAFQMPFPTCTFEMISDDSGLRFFWTSFLGLPGGLSFVLKANVVPPIHSKTVREFRENFIIWILARVNGCERSFCDLFFVRNARDLTLDRGLSNWPIISRPRESRDTSADLSYDKSPYFPLPNWGIWGGSHTFNACWIYSRGVFSRPHTFLPNGDYLLKYS